MDSGTLGVFNLIDKRVLSGLVMSAKGTLKRSILLRREEIMDGTSWKDRNASLRGLTVEMQV